MAYRDLKDYIQKNYEQLLQTAIEDFVNRKHDGRGFHSFGVLSLLTEKVENVEVKALACHDDIGPLIKIDVHTSADIVSKGLGTTYYEADRKKRWFTVYLRAVLKDKLENVEVLDVDEFYPGKFDKESALDQYLLPYVYKADLEDLADDFTDFYCCDAKYDGYKLPVDHILDEFEIKCYEADLPDNCFGRVYFRASQATVYENIPNAGEVREENKEIDPGTILISRDKYFLGNYGTKRLTIAHEIIHWYMHKKYFDLLALLDSDADEMSCETEPSYYDDSMPLAQKAHWFAEWQANALAIRIAMPKDLTVKAVHEARAEARQQTFTGDLVEEIIRMVSDKFDVPRYAAKQRLRQLGWDGVDGAFVYVDGMHYPSFWFSEGILDEHQSFVIDRKSYEKLYETDPEFAELINSGRYLYLGYVVCRSNSKYVTVDFTSGKAEFRLLPYAREHADECCLIFNWKSTSYLKDEYEFYGQAYLSREVTAENVIEYSYDKNFNANYKQTQEAINEEAAKYNAALDEGVRVKIDMMQKGCNTFADALIYHMDRKNIGIDDLVERTGLSDTTIKNYRSGKTIPQIDNVMTVCIGLNLSRDLALDLIKKANCSIEADTRQNRAYRMCLDYTDGTIDQWNMILDAFHVPHLPNLRNQNKK